MVNLVLPPLRRTASEASFFAHRVHRYQKDKAGAPYTMHLKRVANRVSDLSSGCPFWDRTDIDEACQIAWLHDSVEDGKTTEGGLIAEGFLNTVMLAVALLTKENGISYADFIASICRGPFLSAILVKLADVEDNSDPERLALLDEATRERLTKKYAGAADVLRTAARERGWQG